MERFSSNSVRESLTRSRTRSRYNGNYYDSGLGSSTPTKKNIKTVRFGDGNKNDSQSASPPKMKSKTSDQILPSKIWGKLKNGYYNMMLNLGGSGASFGDKRVPQARHREASYAPSEFDNRVVMEIYKSMSTTS